MGDKNMLLIERMKDDAVILDVGANHGKYTIPMASKATRRVYAFEPAPTNLEKLREVINDSAVKDYNNIEVHGMALSNKVGVTKLMLHPGNPGGHSIHPALDGNKWKHTREKSVDVATITLDKWCEVNDIDRIDGIKVDVEAHEVEVIQGALKTLKLKRPLLSLETHGTVDCELLRKLLIECGYSVPNDLAINASYLFSFDKPPVM